MDSSFDWMPLEHHQQDEGTCNTYIRFDEDAYPQYTPSDYSASSSEQASWGPDANLNLQPQAFWDLGRLGISSEANQHLDRDEYILQNRWNPEQHSDQDLPGVSSSFDCPPVGIKPQNSNNDCDIPNADFVPQDSIDVLSTTKDFLATFRTLGDWPATAMAVDMQPIRPLHPQPPKRQFDKSAQPMEPKPSVQNTVAPHAHLETLLSFPPSRASGGTADPSRATEPDLIAPDSTLLHSRVTTSREEPVELAEICQPEIILQHETRPISQEQLVAEVKGIYAGLVMVENRYFTSRISGHIHIALEGLHRAANDTKSPSNTRNASDNTQSGSMWVLYLFAGLLKVAERLGFEREVEFAYILVQKKWLKCQEDVKEFLRRRLTGSSNEAQPNVAEFRNHLDDKRKSIKRRHSEEDISEHDQQRPKFSHCCSDPVPPGQLFSNLGDSEAGASNTTRTVSDSQLRLLAMPRGSTSSNTKRSSNNQNLNSSTHNGGLAPSKRQQARSRASSNANTHVPAANTNGSASSLSSISSISQLSQTASDDVQSSGRTSIHQESPLGKLAVNGLAMAANNSSGNLSTGSIARMHVDGDGSTTTGSTTPQKRMIDLDSSVPSVSASDGHYKTILSSWPLIDSLTLLIILLQLPTTLLTLVHLLFASLSFVPHNLTLLGPNPGAPTFNYGAISNYIFQGQQGGPSVLTIIISDVIMAVVSMLLWPSARIFLVDLAQAVVALTLGAGSSGPGNSGAMRNAAVCASVVGISQILRERSQIAQHLGIPVPPAAGNELNTLAPSTQSPGTIRSALAVHIVAQGVMKAMRRWLTLRDPAEYAASHPTTSSSSSNIASSSLLSPANHGSSTAKASTASSVVPNTPKDPEAACPTTSTTSTTTKKKGKLGGWVRGQQPLWASLANIIVHLKEVEKLHAANANDSKPALSDTVSASEEPKVWITRIGSTEIEFGSNYHAPNTFLEDESVDKRFPFIVELNGIKWPQTTISKASGSGGSGGAEDSTISRTRDEEEWTAEISGLTPTTVYDISFIRRTTGEIIYSASVGTTAKQATNVDAPKEPAPLKPQRPLSPITTLHNSLNASRNKLEDQKRRIKVSKKANSRCISSLRSEIDSLKSRLGSGDKGDERARRRTLSLRDSVRRAEDETENLQMELQTLKELPEDQETEWEEKKKSWKSEKENLTISEKDATTMREQADRRISEIKSEITSTTTKRDKAARRVVNLRADLERTKMETAATAEEREKAKQRDLLKQRRQNIELEFSASIAKMEQGMVSFRQKARENYTNIRTLENSFMMQQQQAAQAQQLVMGSGATATDMAFPLAMQLNQSMSPRTAFGQQQIYNHPYGPFYGQPSPHNSGSFSNINNLQQQQNPIVSPFPSAYPTYDRGRSTSIFSMDSALTNLSDYDNGRKKSLPGAASSSSSSGSDNQEIDGYGNHIATSAGYFGAAEVSQPFAEKLKSGVAFPPLPPPSGHTSASPKSEAIAQ
ncbi:Ubiquitination network signaling protein ac [Drechslerella dactyloides]|uniref:Ubiquitination network signaling protein ac n=1 Tax=Drechslerella dactyloides TaxID=74499 RepID=A0AAD6NIM3_DREDA|nr:Ubiquitination network signaling protein ac [Drechslerella dactyloides]